MIKRISLILCIFLFNSCEKQDENINPFIPDVSFEKTINLSLPNYDNLNYNGGSYFLQNVGVKGVILFNLNNSILAWEASCPNEKPSNCSTMEIQGLQAECQCNFNLYSLANGQPLKINTSNSYPMVAYFTQKSGNSLRIYN